MRAKWGFVVLVLLITVTSRSAIGQEANWVTMCTPDLIALIEAGSSAFDLDPACAAFTACLDEGAAPSLCQLRATIPLFEACAGDSLCETQAIITGAALALGVDDSPSVDSTPPSAERIAATFADGLAAVEAGNYQDAASIFVQGLDSDVFMLVIEIPMLQLNRAAALRLGGDSTAFLLNELPVNPLIQYVQVQEAITAEDSESAAYLIAVLRQFVGDDPVLAPIFEAWQTDYPFDTSTYEDWLLYPTTRRISNPQLGSLYTRFTEVPRPVKLFRGENGMVTLLEMSTADDTWIAGNRPLLLQFPSSNQSLRGDEVEVFTYYQLREQDYGFEIVAIESVGREHTTDIALLAPANAPSPRYGFPTVYCDMLLALSPSQTVLAYTFIDGSLLAIYDDIDGQVISEVNAALLLEETHCAGDTLWWRVELRTGEQGWVRVNDGQQILVMSYPGAFDPIYCFGASIPRLAHSMEGIVSEGAGEQPIYESSYPLPDLSSAPVAMVPEGATFFVAESNICADGSFWIKVFLHDPIPNSRVIEGWMREGDGDTYWLEPLLPW